MLTEMSGFMARALLEGGAFIVFARVGEKGLFNVSGNSNDVKALAFEIPELVSGSLLKTRILNPKEDPCQAASTT